MTGSRARLAVLGAALCFSTGGAAIKLCGLTPWQVAGFRSGFAALALFAFLPAARRLSWRSVPPAFAYAACLVLFALANRLTTSASTIFLQSTAPLYLLLIGPLLLHEKIRGRDLGLMAALAVGMALFFFGAEPAQVTAPNPALGNKLALLSGVAWALSIAGMRWLGRAERGGTASAAGGAALGNVIAFAACLPFALPLGPSAPRDWLVVAFLGVVQIGVAYALLTAALRHVAALEASLLLLLEPVLNPVWTFAVHGERPGALAMAGGAVILGATAVQAWRGRAAS